MSEGGNVLHSRRPGALLRSFVIGEQSRLRCTGWAGGLSAGTDAATFHNSRLAFRAPDAKPRRRKNLPCSNLDVVQREHVAASPPSPAVLIACSRYICGRERGVCEIMTSRRPA